MSFENVFKQHPWGVVSTLSTATSPYIYWFNLQLWGNQSDIESFGLFTDTHISISISISIYLYIFSRENEGNYPRQTLSDHFPF